MRYVFDDCELDVEAVALRRAGQPVPVEPQVFDVLVALLRHRDRVVTKTELLDEVWHHRFVTDSALSSRIKSARRAIGDDGRTQRLIRTVHGRGFQFVGAVEESGPSATTPAGPEGPTGAPRARLPRLATPTIGRDDDIARIAGLVTGAPVLTLLGPGGVGKTRLAVEVASRWEGAAAFVDLTKVRSAELVPDLVVQELGVQGSDTSATEQVLAEALRGQSMLLVLDNFEHVLEAAPFVADLVAMSPGLRALVASRARLRIGGEQVVDVEPLATEPAAEGGTGATSAAVALFGQVATAIDPAFDLAAHLADVTTICRTVDGLPLAIELAAGQLRTLSPALLRTRLGARLGAPGAGARDAPARQQTIPAMVDWSLQLLGPDERRLFARLGVFTGPVSLELVERACGAPPLDDALTALTDLVDHSLVRRVPGARGEPRFVLLELLRERARELLLQSDDAAVVAERHATAVATLLDELDERRWDELADRWIDHLTELLSEIRAAHAWAEEHDDPELAARIVAAMGTYWHREGHLVEGRRWVDALDGRTAGLDANLRARVELAAGFVDWPLDERAAGEHWQNAIHAFRELGDDRYLAYALVLSAGPYIGERDAYEEGLRICDEGIELARRVGDRPLIAQGLNIRGEITRVQGHDDLAFEAYEEGRRLAVEAGDHAHLSMFLTNLAYLADHRGDHAEARRLACESLRLCWGLGRRMMTAWTISELAGPELGLGRPERAARLIGAADEALRVLGVSRHPGDRSEHERVMAGLRAALDREALDRAMAEGARLSLAEAVALALSEPD